MTILEEKQAAVKVANCRRRELLLRCPFCACDAYFRLVLGYETITVECAGSDCEASINGFTTVDEAIAAWNLRRTEPTEEDVLCEQATALGSQKPPRLLTRASTVTFTAVWDGHVQAI